jgi:endonuclease-8
MPEGHTVHRLARRHLSVFGRHPVGVSSPQGRFEQGAGLLDGRDLVGAQAHGKHEFLRFAGDLWLHVHLGLYGKWTFGEGDPPPARGAVRVRLVGDGAWADLRGPTACGVLDGAEVTAIRARLGADPLRRDTDPDAAGERVRRSRAPLGALLMQQEIIAGVGNVYRAEALFRARADPWTPGRDLTPDAWRALWADLVTLMRDGVRRGRIVTTLPEDRTRRSGPVRAEDAYYVYRRTGLPCRICGTPVVTEPMVARNLYRCPVCQAPDRTGAVAAGVRTARRSTVRTAT